MTYFPISSREKFNTVSGDVCLVAVSTAAVAASSVLFIKELQGETF
jgi:hypothetical protein